MMMPPHLVVFRLEAERCHVPVVTIQADQLLAALNVPLHNLHVAGT